MLNNLIQNKWYKLSKYSVAAFLIMSSLLALVAAWFVGSNDSATLNVVPGLNNETYGTVCMVFGFIGLAAAVVLLATKNNAILSVTMMVVAVSISIVLIVLSSIIMSQTEWVKITPVP